MHGEGREGGGDPLFRGKNHKFSKKDISKTETEVLTVVGYGWRTSQDKIHP